MWDEYSDCYVDYEPSPDDWDFPCSQTYRGGYLQYHRLQNPGYEPIIDVGNTKYNTKEDSIYNKYSNIYSRDMDNLRKELAITNEELNNMKQYVSKQNKYSNNRF